MAPLGCLQSQVLLSCHRPQVTLCQNSALYSACPTSSFLIHTTSSSTSSLLLTSSQGFLSSRWSSFLYSPVSGNNVQAQSRSLRLIAKANDSMADDSLPSEMSLENALKLLGVREGASFEEILAAKKIMVENCSEDQARLTQVEAAYDMLLMQSLSLRRAGKVMDNTIRYADVKKAKFPVSGSGPEWLRTALKNTPVAFQIPSSSVIGTQTGVYLALGVWMFASGLASTRNESSLSAGADVPGIILAIGFGLSLYFLCKQNLKLGKATLITVAGLFVGAGLGGLVESWLQVDIVPVLGIGSPAVVVSEFVLFSLWASSLYLR
ncbi:unnamed protein product [Sphagnum jensenii]